MTDPTPVKRDAARVEDVGVADDGEAFLVEAAGGGRGPGTGGAFLVTHLVLGE